MRWAVNFGSDGRPESMAWLGPTCEHRSAGGWWCEKREGHEGEHGALHAGWVTTWDGDGPECHRDASVLRSLIRTSTDSAVHTEPNPTPPTEAA